MQLLSFKLNLSGLPETVDQGLLAGNLVVEQHLERILGLFDQEVAYSLRN